MAYESSVRCRTDQERRWREDNDILFWDVRSAGEYAGIDPRSNPPARAGHIPRAVNLEWTELVASATGLFKPADEMRRLLDAKGLTPDKEIVSYCQPKGRGFQVRFLVRATLCTAEVRTTEEPEAGKPHVRDCMGGAG